MPIKYFFISLRKNVIFIIWKMAVSIDFTGFEALLSMNRGVFKQDGHSSCKKIKENRNFGYILVTSAYNILPAKGSPYWAAACKCY